MEISTINMDKKDLAILGAIRENARAPMRELAREARLPITTVHNRLKQLETAGVIVGYHAILNYVKLGKPVLAYIFLTVDYTKFKTLTQLEIKKRIIREVEPEEAYIITGSFDIMLKMRFSSTGQISETIEILRKIEGVDKTQTMVVIE